MIGQTPSYVGATPTPSNLKTPDILNQMTPAKSSDGKNNLPKEIDLTLMKSLTYSYHLQKMDMKSLKSLKVTVDNPRNPLIMLVMNKAIKFLMVKPQLKH